MNRKSIITFQIWFDLTFKNICPRVGVAVTTVVRIQILEYKIPSLYIEFNSDHYSVFTVLNKYVYIFFCRLIQLLSKAMSHFMCKDYSVKIYTEYFKIL